MNVSFQYNPFKTVKSTALFLKKDNRGDTIVEVLIAMAIIGLVLAISIAGANRSTAFIRQSHERNEALKIVEQQVEQLYAMSASDYENIVNTTNEAFCLDGANNVISFGSVTPPVNYWEDTLTSPAYPAECLTGRYYTHIIKDADPSAPEGTFLFRTRWVRLGSNNIDEVPIVWRRNLVAISSSSPSSPSLSSTPVCPLSPQTGRRLITWDVNDAKLQSYDLGTPTYSLGADLTGGTYDITAISFDDHEQDDVDNPQPYEYFHFVLLDSSNNELYRSPLTADVPDILGNIYQTSAFSSETFTGTATQFRMERPGSYPGNNGSVWPVCITFDTTGPPPPIGTCTASSIIDIPESDGIQWVRPGAVAPPNSVNSLSRSLAGQELTPCRYNLEVTTTELDHATAWYDQDQERIYVVGYDATGAVTFKTPYTVDVPECPQASIPLSPSHPAYNNCTRSVSNFTVDLRLDLLPTVRVDINHVSAENDSLGCPGPTCMTDSSQQSTHGGRLVFTPY